MGEKEEYKKAKKIRDEKTAEFLDLYKKFRNSTESEKPSLEKELNGAKEELIKIQRAEKLAWWKAIDKPFSDSNSIPELPSDISEKEWAEIYRPALIRCGAIPKENLEVGAKYLGHCNNASEATWDGEEFTYVRTKWNVTYPEGIPHFDDVWNTSKDCFIPIKKI